MMDNNTVYEWILQTTFTVSARAQTLQKMEAYLAGLVQSGYEILDLCCGSGFVSFWFEAQGAKVSGMDFAPYMIALAREEARRRNSTVEFIEADIFTQDFRPQRFDLISCIDSVSDFSLSDFAKLGKKIASALKPGGRFVVKYVDGSYKFIQGTVTCEGVYQEEPERITYRFKEYLPEIGASVNIIRNETRHEAYERKGYIYTVPVVHLLMSSAFQLERHIVLDENQFMDIFIKPK
jgi:ubiquinone/menaquinone biosynthesis C-methylase UbiE